jgi:hypothetical protein
MLQVHEVSLHQEITKIEILGHRGVIVEVFAIMEYGVAQLDGLSPTFRYSAMIYTFMGRKTDEELN